MHYKYGCPCDLIGYGACFHIGLQRQLFFQNEASQMWMCLCFDIPKIMCLTRCMWDFLGKKTRKYGNLNPLQYKPFVL